MKTWSTPAPAALPVQPDRLRVFDTASQSLRHPGNDAERASLYVCGITPYDATHLGHATTYVAFDLLQRYWRAAGLEVAYTQNVTDVDDPLLEGRRPPAWTGAPLRRTRPSCSARTWPR